MSGRLPGVDGAVMHRAMSRYSQAGQAQGVIEALKDEPDKDVPGIRFILDLLARAVVNGQRALYPAQHGHLGLGVVTTMPIRRNLALHALEADAVARPDLAFKAFAKDVFARPAD